MGTVPAAWYAGGVGTVAVWWADIWGGGFARRRGTGCGVVMTRRGHEGGGDGLVLSVGVHGCDIVGVGFGVAAGVGVVVDAGMPGQFVGAGEPFTAARELTGVWFFAGVGSDVSGLMLESVKGFVAEGAFVGSWEVLRVEIGCLVEAGHYRRHMAHLDCSHFVGILVRSAIVWCFGIQQAGKLHC